MNKLICWSACVLISYRCFILRFVTAFTIYWAFAFSATWCVFQSCFLLEIVQNSRMLDLTKYTTAVFMNNGQRETANSLNY